MKLFALNTFRMAKKNKGSFLGAVFVIAIGIFVFVAMIDTLQNLKGQVDSYYEKNALADVFAEVSGISSVQLEALEELPGIKKASGRLTKDVRILAEGQTEMASVHLLSAGDEEEEAESLNRMTRTTAKNTAGTRDMIWLGKRMIDACGYEPGDTLRLLIGGISHEFVLAGTVSTPDSIYSIPPGGAMVPDGETYDIACIEKKRMEELTGSGDMLTELGFLLESGYTYENVRGSLSDALRQYGLISLTDRADQASYDMVSGEVSELISMGTILPVMFLAISVFMLYVVLKKMVDRDQSLIGTMKAFGLTDRELMASYLMLGVAAGVIGSLIGDVLAIPFGKYMFDMYVEFFNLPDTVYHNYIGTRIGGAALAAATGIGAVFLGVRDILKINPAQAMRQRMPDLKRTGKLPDLFERHLKLPAKMAFRSLLRNPFRACMIALAVGFPFSMASVLFSFRSVEDQMYFDQFDKIQTFDFEMTLDRYESPVRAAESGLLLDGVEDAEAVYSGAVQLRNENRTEFAMLYGLNKNSSMWKIMDIYRNVFDPPSGGVILNERIAKKLHVKRGGRLQVSIPGVTIRETTVPVADVIAESVGSGCYMELASMGDTFGISLPVNAVLLKTEAGSRETVKQKIMETNRVTGLVDTGKIVKSYQEMMSSMMMMVNLFAVLSVAAGGVLIYNISMINIRERVTEFGTLKVLGQTEKEIGLMMLLEHMAAFFVGILMGFPGSIGLKVLVEKIIVSDSYTIDLIVTPFAYIEAFVICLGIAALAFLTEMKFVKNISLTEVLKERE